MGSYLIDFSQLPSLTNKWVQQIFNNTARYIVCKGGAASGKSYGICQLIIYKFLVEKGHKILVIRKVARTLRDSIFQLMVDVIESYGCTQLVKINKTDMSIECIGNGNKILFKGIDDGGEKIKSIQGITDLVIEEASELTLADFSQLNVRIRGNSNYKKQIYLMFNPIDIKHWLKKEFFDKKKPDSIVIETTYKNNRFIDKESITVLESFKDSDPYYYAVYCLGNWGSTGKTIFAANKVQQRIEFIQNNKKKVGYFKYVYLDQKIIDSSIQWIDDDENGYITIYKDPIPNKPYVIGADTSGDGSDFFAGHALDNITAEQVAVYHKQTDEDLFAKQMYCLGMYYNNALIGIEINFSTYPVRELQRLGYMRMYMREEFDSMTNLPQKKFGFRTTSITRPVILSNLIELVREHTHLLNDKSTLEELLTFTRNAKGKMTASNGAHDDLVISLAIAHHIRQQQSMYFEESHIEEDEDDTDHPDYSGSWYD